MAPELYLDVQNVRTDSTDIYALSITIWEVSTELLSIHCEVAEMPSQIFALKLPFFHIRDTFAVTSRVALGERPVKLIDCESIGFTDGLWALMQRGWAARSGARPALAAFVEVLQEMQA
jgi:hypothetical protein